MPFFQDGNLGSNPSKATILNGKKLNRYKPQTINLKIIGSSPIFSTIIKRIILV